MRGAARAGFAEGRRGDASGDRSSSRPIVTCTTADGSVAAAVASRRFGAAAAVEAGEGVRVSIEGRAAASVGSRHGAMRLAMSVIGVRDGSAAAGSAGEGMGAASGRGDAVRMAGTAVATAWTDAGRSADAGPGPSRGVVRTPCSAGVGTPCKACWTDGGSEISWITEARRFSCGSASTLARGVRMGDAGLSSPRSCATGAGRVRAKGAGKTSSSLAMPGAAMDAFSGSAASKRDKGRGLMRGRGSTSRAARRSR